jgi:hypothetical protein
MKSLKMYCFSLANSNLDKIKKINYIPVGLGKGKFEKEWLRENTKDNISEKNSWYGENTFYYWLWKNELKKNFDADWIGFCHYRRFWLKDGKEKNYDNFKKSIVQEAPIEWKNHEVVLRDEVYVNSTKLSKILKYGKRQLIKNPFVFLSKKTMTVKVHYDMYHGYGEMDKAIELLDDENREDFRKWVNTEGSFNANNVFICKSHSLYNDYCKSLFNWLERCEEIFGFDPKRSYSRIRVYAFLAERYLSYWFKKNSNYILWPMKFHDITNDKVNF